MNLAGNFPSHRFGVLKRGYTPLEGDFKGVSPLIRLPTNKTFALVYALSRVARMSHVQLGQAEGFFSTLLRLHLLRLSDLLHNGAASGEYPSRLTRSMPLSLD